MVKVTKSSPSLQPGAWVVTNNQQDKSKPSDKGRKSIKNGKVYLDDDQNFEVELYNPLQECVLCDIKLDGKSISESGLVLKPGQRFYLDCFLDDKKKFIFKTYEVENTDESKNAISKNGMLEVYFYKEKAISINNWRNRFDRVIVERYYPVYYPSYHPVYYPSPYYTYGSYPSVLCGSSGTLTTNSLFNATTTNCGTSYGTLTNGSNLVGCVQSPTSTYTNNVTLDNLQNVETGRTEKGSSSSQEFSEIDMEFQSNYISHTIIQLLPNSRKPIETDEIKKCFCTNCGTKMKESFKFCPGCGNKI